MIAERVYVAIEKESGNESKVAFIKEQISFEVVGIDSLSIVSVVILIEDEFNIVIKGKEISAATSIPKLIALVESKI